MFRLAVLRMWRSKYGPNATYGNLATRLYYAVKLEVMEAVCQALRTPRVDGNLHGKWNLNVIMLRYDAIEYWNVIGQCLDSRILSGYLESSVLT